MKISYLKVIIIMMSIFSLLNPFNAYAGKYREIKAELKHTFPTKWHTPQWKQIDMISGHPVGCGGTAWAIVYAYWRAFKEKKELFDGYDVYENSAVRDSEDQQIRTVMGEAARYTETDYGNVGGRYGFTQPRNMEKGIRYAKNKGYRDSTCVRIRGTEFNKFGRIKRWLDADKPVILLIKESDHQGIPNHYVVIEAAVKKQKRVLGKWHDRDVKYLVNFGHGPKAKNARKWIYVREVGRNTHKVWTSASAYLIDIR